MKRLIKLRDRSFRDTEGVFVVEGERLFQRAIAAGLVPVEVYGTSELDITSQMITVKAEVLDRVSYRKKSEGLIAIFPSLDTSAKKLERITDGVILIVENVEKPGNLGAMARTAYATGAEAIVTVGHSADIHNPNVLRASTGAIFDIPVIATNWDSLAVWAGQTGFLFVGAVVDAETVFWDSELREKIGIVIGAEDTGLTSESLSHLSQQLTIPQTRSGIDSLNASVAAALLLYESARQRR